MKEGSLKIQRFLAHLESFGCSPETIRGYNCDLEQFGRFLSQKKLRLNQVDFKAIDEYVRSLSNGKKLSAASVSRRLAGLSSFLDYRSAISNGRLRNPMGGFRRPRLTPQGPQPIDESTLQMLLAGVSNPRDKAIIELFVKSGLRISELHSLNRDSIQVEKEPGSDGEPIILGVGEVIGKGNKKRRFLVDEAMCKCLSALLSKRRNDGLSPLFISSRGTRLSTRAIRQRLHYWCNTLDLQRLRAHQLRHTYATRMINVDMPTLTLKDLMGHASLATTLRYLKIADRKVAREYFAAMELLAGKSGK